MPKPKERTEIEIQRQILMALWAFRIDAWRVNVSSIRGRPAPNVGMSDIIGVEDDTGRIVAIEVKRPGGKLRPSQVEFLGRVARRGGLAMAISSLDELFATMRIVQEATQLGRGAPTSSSLVFGLKPPRVRRPGSNQPIRLAAT